MMYAMTDLRKRVANERRIRGWSVRKAAQLGRISNSTWGGWENGALELGDAMRIAVATAFDWEPTWPENPPPDPFNAASDAPDLHKLADEIAALRAELADAVSELRAAADQPRRTAKKPPVRD